MFKEAKIERIVTRPTVSMTAKSDPVGPQQRCFKRPPSRFAVNGAVGLGSLRPQEPVRGSQRKFLNSRAVPSVVKEAMLPHLPQAIAL